MQERLLAAIIHRMCLLRKIVSLDFGRDRLLRAVLHSECAVTQCETKCHIVRCRLDMVRSAPHAAYGLCAICNTKNNSQRQRTGPMNEQII
jgi:hypothetical protein